MTRIRLAKANDIPLLTELGRNTIIESFAHLNNPDNFQAHLNKHHVLAVIEMEFNNPKNHFYIAEYNSNPAGFCKLVFDEDENQPDLKDKKCLMLERLYILNQYQGLHIGRQFLENAIEIGLKMQFEILWLGVWENNLKAREIYKKWNFTEFGSHSFDMGGDIQTDLLMKKHLNRLTSIN